MSTRAAPKASWRPRGLFLWMGGALLCGFLALAAIGPALAPYDPGTQDLLAVLDPPSAAHLLGTDQVGRDILSRVIVGTRVTLTIVLVSTLLAGSVGVGLGLIAGTVGGAVDRAIVTLLDLLLTIPSLVLAITIVAAVGADVSGLLAAIAISFVPSLARLVRARVLEIRREDYIEAARSVGMGTGRLACRHILPNAVSVVIIELSLMAGQAVLIASALGFLGLGVQPPNPEWGAMLGASRENLEVAPFVVIGPGLAVSLLVLACNLFGDGLRDRLDPNVSH